MAKCPDCKWDLDEAGKCPRCEQFHRHGALCICPTCTYYEEADDGWKLPNEDGD